MNTTYPIFAYLVTIKTSLMSLAYMQPVSPVQGRMRWWLTKSAALGLRNQNRSAQGRQAKTDSRSSESFSGPVSSAKSAVLIKFCVLEVFQNGKKFRISLQSHAAYEVKRSDLQEGSRLIADRLTRLNARMLHIRYCIGDPCNFCEARCVSLWMRDNDARMLPGRREFLSFRRPLSYLSDEYTRACPLDAQGSVPFA